MSSISSGSALDVNALVTQLMTAERAPYSARFNRLEAVAKARISAFGTLSSAFAGLKTALDKLGSSATYGARTATSSDDKVLTASATSAAGTGSYNVEVVSLSSAHKLVSAGLTAGTDLGAGQLTLNTGATTFTVNLAADASTPAEIRDAINAAATLAGAKVKATIVESDSGQRLVLTATQAGAGNAIKVTNTSSPANAALNALVYDPGNLVNLSEEAEATDAVVKVDGITKSSNSNTVTGFVPGLTLNLISAAPGNIKTLTVSADNSVARSAVQGMITAYNAAVSALNTATKYNAETNTPSSLTGDSSARSAATQLRSALGAAFAEAADAGYSAADLGLSTNVDGTLSFTASKFDAAMAADPEAVQAVFAGDDGFSERLGAVVSSFTGSDGVFTSRTAELNNQLKSVATQREAAERRLSSIEERYRKQFTALDTLLAQAQSTSNFLAQQLASLSAR